MKTKVNDLLLKQECYAIMGGCFAVYKDKGCGFLEDVYQECLEIEFDHLKIPTAAKPRLPLSYRGRTLRKQYEADFICYDRMIIEIKAVNTLIDEHRAQVINYLNATGFELGLLINFGHYPKIEWERIANTKKPHDTIYVADFS